MPAGSARPLRGVLNEVCAGSREDANGYSLLISSTGREASVFNRFRLMWSLSGLLAVAGVCSAFVSNGSVVSQFVFGATGLGGFFLGWFASARNARAQALPLWLSSFMLPPLCLATFLWLVLAMAAEPANLGEVALGTVVLTSPMWLLVSVPWALWTARNERPSLW